MDAPLKFGGHAVSHLEAERGAEQGFSVSEIVELLTGFIRRQFPIFVFFIACGLALGMVYLLTTPASYTSHAMLLIDSSKLRILQQQQTPIGDVPIDTAQVETQLEILKSENIGLAVVKELKLTEDPEFVGPNAGLLGQISGFLGGTPQRSEEAQTRAALGRFLGKRTVARVARTYVIDIGFTSLNPARAAAIANAIADAYIVDQLEAKYQATRRASVWLQDRIRELRQQASDADRAVLDYKEKNNIISLGGSASGGQRLLGEQQLEELNTQLGSARAAAQESKARLERITEVMRKDVPDATVTDSLKNDVINKLRNQYLEFSAKESIWSARYGSGHLAAVNLRTQMAELRRSIQDELGRIAEGYKSDYEIAKSRVEGLEQELQKLVASSQITNRDRLGLTDLESTAKVYHSIYDSFLQRYMEAIQQQSFPITEARVISVAATPSGKSSPLTFSVLGIAAILGIIASFAAATMREAMDQVFRMTRHVETTLHLNCLAVLPHLAAPSKMGIKNFSRAAGLRREGRSAKDGNGVKRHAAAAQPGTGSDKVADLMVATLAHDPLNGATTISPAAGRRKIDVPQDKFMRQVVDDPLSAFAEAFRSIKIAADISGRESKAIGVLSTVPGEGKSTIASNFAELIAHSGKKVILVDGDLRNPSLTRAFTPFARVGLLEVLNQKATLNDVVGFDEQTGMAFLPTVVRSRLAHSVEILASDVFERLIETLRKSYDYVIVDLPPLAPVVDARATAQVLDSFIYVIEWGKTRKSLVHRQLKDAPEVFDRILGVVLNKSNLNVLQRYEGQYGGYYSQQYYGQYGSSPT